MLFLSLQLSNSILLQNVNIAMFTVHHFVCTITHIKQLHFDEQIHI